MLCVNLLLLTLKGAVQRFRERVPSLAVVKNKS